MPKKISTTQQSVIPSSITKEQAISLLRLQISKANEYVSNKSLPENEYDSWKILTRDCLIKSFGENSPYIVEVMKVGKGFYVGHIGGPPPDERYKESKRFENLAKQVRMLESYIEILQREIEFQKPKAKEENADVFGKSIFIVHGHDESILSQVAHYLERLDLDVIILREEANEGKTIIEKFIDNSQKAGFAIVLLTPDDMGGNITDEFEKYQPRARQNVIFELGYFIGRLGRERVSALYSEGVEVPSDYTGVLFTKIDPNGFWKFGLARELQAVGIDVDMNKIR